MTFKNEFWNMTRQYLSDLSHKDIVVLVTVGLVLATTAVLTTQVVSKYGRGFQNMEKSSKNGKKIWDLMKLLEMPKKVNMMLKIKHHIYTKFTLYILKD